HRAARARDGGGADRRGGRRGVRAPRGGGRGARRRLTTRRRDTPHREGFSAAALESLVGQGRGRCSSNGGLEPMCGIVGYVGERAAKTLVLAGLERLEYRGYDSAGISVVCDGRLEAVRAVGNLSRLRAAVEAAAPAEDEGGGVAVAAPPATTGIGHTRWATHGRVTEKNAHPHYDTEDRVHVVVNGIVENYLELKQALIAQGAVFSSETDVEVIAHMIARELDVHDLVE